MPWRCPACQSEIKHLVFEDRPRAADAYRCHVCRLDLRFNEVDNRLEIAPLHSEHHVKDAPSRPRSVPNPLPTRKSNKPT